MKIVHSSKRIISLLLALISLITLIFLYMGHLQHILVLETIVENEKDIGGKIYTNTFKLVSEHYESVANSLLLNDDITNAFEKRDRKKLLALTEPIYKQLVAQNPYLKIMHFHTPKSVSFLRVHQPDKFGDDLSSFRYIVNNVNAQKKKQTGLEVGRYGINYRVVVPVFNHQGKHLGSFEFGIDIDYIFNIFHKDYGLENILFVNKEVFKIIHGNNKKLKYKSFSDKYYVLEPSDNSISNIITPSDLAKNYFFVKYKGMENLVFTVTEMKSVTGEEIGKIVFVKNMNAYDSQIAFLRNISVALGLSLVFLSFYLLRKIFHHYTHAIDTYQSQLEIKNRTLSKLSNIDHLTKAHNRRSIERVLSKELNRAKRYEKPLSIIMIDLDDFKHVNDLYGHNTGDTVLKNTAKIIQGMIRESDYFGRWGGEEFVLIVTETPIEKAAIVAEQIRKAINTHDFSEPSSVTCSIGIAQMRTGDNATEVVAKADSALYQAKNSGKNKVVLYKEKGE
ncbi:MAG TPA: diguanylate cyclase [Sulfuricurvum sp.]|nr:diguanylate cyclase [Sulfuricurvum sp.]HZF69326.1 diguanylate cyclase [Sulfuricurvum sp.]